MWNQTHILILVKKLIIKVINLKLVIFLEYQNIKKIFAKGYTPNWSEDILVIKKVKNTMLLTYVINDRNGVEIVGMFYENELQNKKQIKKILELKK